ncbi:hypothetical protein [Paenibacillus chitinolyticus]|uniref:hypothetical protein n=1 Tax=Paenibacillus chitinolyticus TaxID=79263 RepID=UPI001C464006|nr:hypothetical protein [Paenibacillus chitinolyticus]MBV6716252.1 hypothetical protein [Paenibacillus chitinolyticus]
MQAKPGGKYNGGQPSSFSNAVWDVHVNLPPQAENASVSIAGDMIRLLQIREASIELDTWAGSFRIPAGQIGIGAATGQFGPGVRLSEMTVSFEISMGRKEREALLTGEAGSGRYRLLSGPVDFAVIVSCGDKKMKLENLPDIELALPLPLPDGLEPDRAINVLVLDRKGSVRLLPAHRVNRKGRMMAAANGAGDGIFVLVVKRGER